MNAQDIAAFFDSATTEQKAVFNNNANGITIADKFEGSISPQDRAEAMQAATAIQSISVHDVNAYTVKTEGRDVPC